MSRLTFRGDAPDIAQRSFLPAPPADFVGVMRVGVSNKFLEFTAWDAAKVAAAWNAAAASEFKSAVATVGTGGVVLTAATPGVPFIAWLNYATTAGGSEAVFDEIVIITKTNFGTVTGTVDITFNGETVQVAAGFDAAALQTALESLDSVTSGDVVCSDLSATKIQVKYSGAYAGIDAPALTIEDEDLRGGTAAISVSTIRSHTDGGNEVQRIVISGAPTGGQITYEHDGTSIGPLDFDDDETAYQTAFNAALGSGNSDVTFADDPTVLGPALKLYPRTSAEDQDGYWKNDGSGFTTSGDLVAGVVAGETTTIFSRLVTATAIPANVAVESAWARFSVKSADVNARIPVTIKAVDAASPAAISSYADFGTRVLTTASATATILPNGLGLINLAAILQELVDSYGAVSNMVLIITCGSGSVGQITWNGWSAGGQVAGTDPFLEVTYRDTATGPVVIDVEFIGSLAEQNVPLLTVKTNTLTPLIRNTTWRTETSIDTGAPAGLPGIAQLYRGATLLNSAGTETDPQEFTTAVDTLLDDYFGTGNFLIRSVPAAAGRFEIELTGDYSGIVDIPDDLILYWTPVGEGGETYTPTVSVSVIQEGGAGALGEVQKITITTIPTGGTFALRVGAYTSSSLAWSATAAQIKTALESLTSVGSGKVVSVTGSWDSGWTVEFHSSLGNVPTIEVINNLSNVTVSWTFISSEAVNPEEFTKAVTYFFSVNSQFAGNVTFGLGAASTNVSSSGGYQTAMETTIKNLIQSAHPGAYVNSAVSSHSVVGGNGYITFTLLTNSAAFTPTETPSQNWIGMSGMTENLTPGEYTQTRNTIGVTISGQPTSGTWTLTLKETHEGSSTTTTTTINVPAAYGAASIQALLAGYVDGIVTVTSNVEENDTIFTFVITSDIYYYEIEAAKGTLTAGAITASVTTTREYSAATNEKQQLRFLEHDFCVGGFVRFYYSTDDSVAFWYGPPFDDLTLKTVLVDLLSVTDADISVAMVDGPNLARGDRDFVIEFKGSLAGTNIATLSVNYDLDGAVDDPDEFETATWALIQDGANGAAVTITETTAGAAPAGAQKLVTISGSPHYGTYTLTINAETTSALQYNADAAANLTAVNALSGITSGQVNIIGDLAGGLLFDFVEALGAITMTATDVDLTNAQTTAVETVKGGSRAAQELVRSSGKNHFDDPQNWKVLETGESRVPNSGDVIVFENGRVGCLYGLKQRTTFTVLDAKIKLTDRADFRVGQTVMVSSSDTLPAGLSSATVYTVATYDRATRSLTLTNSGSAVTITDEGTGTHTIRLAVDSIIHHSRFTGPIGLPFTNALGFREYLPITLDIGLKSGGSQLLKIGEGNGSSSGRMRFDLGADPHLCEVHNTGGSTETGVPALVLNGTNDQSEFEQFDGDTGLGFFEGAEYRFKKLRVHSGSLFYGKIVSSANCELRNLGGQIDGREGTITGKIASKP